jgi:hypothetical protein
MKRSKLLLRKAFRNIFLLAALLVLVVAPSALAQDSGGQLPEGALGDVIAWVTSAAGLTLIAQLLQWLGVVVPDKLRPLVGPVLGVVAAGIFIAVGVMPDFGIIEGILLGTTSAVVFDVGKKFRVFSTASSRARMR